VDQLQVAMANEDCWRRMCHPFKRFGRMASDLLKIIYVAFQFSE
jgi:hypothetical protein